MAYSTYGETYDPYTMAQSMSRGQSYGYPSSNYSGYSAGYPGSYPGTPYPGQASMYQDGSEYSQYQQPYSSYGGVPSSAISRRITGQGHGYDDDPYYGNQQLALSSSMGGPRQRRHSTVSFAARPPGLDAYRSPSALHLKFKRKGSFTSGIGLDEAQSTHIRLSGNDAYTFHDLHADGRKRIHLRVKWTGYSSLTYEIPLDGYDGRVDLQTLARRVSRACVHYLQANVIPILWDRVILHHLEEVSYGVWQPMLSTR